MKEKGPVPLCRPVFAERLDVADLAPGFEAALEGARTAGLSEATVRGVLTLESAAGLPTTDAARLFPEYLARVNRP